MKGPRYACVLLTPCDLHRNTDWPSLAGGAIAIWIGDGDQPVRAADSASGLFGTAMQSTRLAAAFVLPQWSPVIRMIDHAYGGSGISICGD